MTGKKIKLAIFAIIMTSFATLLCPGLISVEQVVEAKEIQVRADILEWRYKVIDGHFYKRLFNCSTGEWETDWILVQ